MGPRRSSRPVGSMVRKTKVVEEKVSVITIVDSAIPLSLNISAGEPSTTQARKVVNVVEGNGKQKASETKQEKKPKELPAKKGTQVKDKEAGVAKQERRKSRKRTKRRADEGGIGSYKSYVYKVLKQVHPELGISSNAMAVLNGFMRDMFERLADEAANLSKYTNRATLSSREIQAAVRLVLPGELGKHAISEGSKAISNYYAYKQG